MTFFGTIPSTTPPNGVLAAYWVDLVLGADGVCAVTVGSAPSRRFIVQWRNAQFYSGVKATPTAGSASFEVIYNEADRSIDFLYDTISGQPMGAPTRAAVGVETLSGSSGLAICAGGRIDATPPATDYTMVTSGTRFQARPIGLIRDDYIAPRAWNAQYAGHPEGSGGGPRRAAHPLGGGRRGTPPPVDP